MSGEVHRKSIFFSPKDIGPLPDSKAHSIAYRDSLPYAWLCSGPKEIRATSFETLETEVLTRLGEARFRTLRVAAPEMREQIRSVVSNSMRETEATIAEQIRARRAPGVPDAVDHRERPIEDILAAREMARIDLGIELVVAQPRNV